MTRLEHQNGCVRAERRIPPQTVGRPRKFHTEACRSAFNAELQRLVRYAASVRSELELEQGKAGWSIYQGSHGKSARRIVLRNLRAELAKAEEDIRLMRAMAGQVPAPTEPQEAS